MPIDLWFDDLYIEFYPKLLSVALRLTDDAHLAEDIVQNTFLALHEQQADLIHHPNIRGWLVVTLRKKLQTELQRRSRTQEVPLEEGIRQTRDPESEESFQNIIPAALSAEERRLLDLHFRQGYSHAEIGRYLGCSETACRMRLLRLITKCRKLLKNENF